MATYTSKARLPSQGKTVCDFRPLTLGSMQIFGTEVLEIQWYQTRRGWCVRYPPPNARNRCASCQLTTTVLNWHPSVFCTTRAYGHRCVHGQFHAICFSRSTKMVVVNWHPRLSIYNLDLVKTRKFPWSSIDNQGYQLTSWSGRRKAFDWKKGIRLEILH